MSTRVPPDSLAITLHELRNQLGVLMVQLEIARLQAAAAHSPDALTNALASATQASEQMSRILEAHRTQSRAFNKTRLNLQSLNLGAWLKDQIHSFRPMCDASSVKLALTLPSQPVDILADEASLGQVLLNLLKNALEAVQDSSRLPETPEIKITLGLEASQVVISIDDNGYGFSAEQAERLLEPGVTHKATGSGIGLWLSRQIIEAHGGTLTLHSDGPHLGCRACVRLPAFVP